MRPLHPNYRILLAFQMSRGRDTSVPTLVRDKHLSVFCFIVVVASHKVKACPISAMTIVIKL